MSLKHLSFNKIFNPIFLPAYNTDEMYLKLLTLQYLNLSLDMVNEDKPKILKYDSDFIVELKYNDRELLKSIGNVLKYEYDDVGRLIKIKYKEDVATIEYTSDVVSVTGYDGKVMVFKQDIKSMLDNDDTDEVVDVLFNGVTYKRFVYTDDTKTIKIRTYNLLIPTTTLDEKNAYIATRHTITLVDGKCTMMVNDETEIILRDEENLSFSINPSSAEVTSLLMNSQYNKIISSTRLYERNEGKLSTVNIIKCTIGVEYLGIGNKSTRVEFIY